MDPSATPAEPDDPDYVVTHTLTVTIRNIDSVGEVIEAATEAGANQTHGVFFGIEDRETLYIEALALAIADAKVKAEAIAEVLGVEIGLPTSVFENQTWNSWDMRGGMGVVTAFDSGGLQMQMGQVEVTAGVGLSFMFERE